MEQPAPTEARARVRARLEATIPEMRRGSGGGGGGSGGGAHNGASSLGLRTIATTTFLLGGITGAALYATLAPPRVMTRVVTVEQPSAPSALSARSAVLPEPTSGAAPSPTLDLGGQPAAVVEPHAAAQAKAGAHPAATSPPHPGPNHPAPKASQLAAERMLLDEARAGLVQGDPERALARLDLHRRRYPGGLLAEERDAMLVEALAKAGRHEEARRAAEAFRARAPASLFLPTVEASVEASVEPTP
jgi:hypothetical protein